MDLTKTFCVFVSGSVEGDNMTVQGGVSVHDTLLRAIMWLFRVACLYMTRC